MANLGLAFASGFAKAANEQAARWRELNQKLQLQEYENAREEWKANQKRYETLETANTMGALGAAWAEMTGHDYEKHKAEIDEHVSKYEKDIMGYFKSTAEEKPNMQNYKNLLGPSPFFAKVRETVGLPNARAAAPYERSKMDSYKGAKIPPLALRNPEEFKTIEHMAVHYATNSKELNPEQKKLVDQKFKDKDTKVEIRSFKDIKTRELVTTITDAEAVSLIKNNPNMIQVGRLSVNPTEMKVEDYKYEAEAMLKTWYNKVLQRPADYAENEVDAAKYIEKQFKLLGDPKKKNRSDIPMLILGVVTEFDKTRDSGATLEERWGFATEQWAKRMLMDKASLFDKTRPAITPPSSLTPKRVSPITEREEAAPSTEPPWMLDPSAAEALANGTGKLVGGASTWQVVEKANPSNIIASGNR